MKWVGSFLRVAVGLLGLFVFNGCVSRFDPETMQPYAEVTAPSVYGDHFVGQTFTPQAPNLAAIELFLQSVPEQSGPLRLHVRRSPMDSTDLWSVDLVVQNDARAIARFPPQSGYTGQSLTFLLEAPDATSDQTVRLLGVSRDVYGAGQAYADGVAWGGDLAFRTYYSYDVRMVWADICFGLSQAWLILPLLALYWAPGFLLLQLWPSRRDADAVERLALAVGLSLAVLPFSLLWITQLGGSVSAPAARGVFAVLAVAGLVVGLRSLLSGSDSRRWGAAQRRNALRRFGPFFSILAIGVVVRGLAARDLAFPAWVDSVHHTTLARIILERGRVPMTYEPYIPLNQASYHFGFHTHVAAFAWLSGLDVPKAMLVVGQVFNGLMALQVYLFAKWLTQRRRVAVFAAWIVALLSSMPAYYLSWGRYTQLAGLLILPSAACLTIDGTGKRDRQAQGLAVLATAGLMLTHYRVLAFFVCLIAVFWFMRLIQDRSSWRTRLCECAAYAGLFAVAALTLMPWLLETALSLWIPSAVRRGVGANATTAALSDFSLSYVNHGVDRYLLTLGLLGAVVAVIDRQPFAGTLLLWVGSIFAVTNPSVFRLPGESLTNNVAMLIMWFIPLAIWCGFLFDVLVASWSRVLQGGLRWAGCVLGIGLCGGLSVLGVINQVTILNPECVFALAADQPALAWIADQLPEEACVLINARPWQGRIYMGVDGGYWITLASGRQTTVPPALYSLGSADSILDVEALNLEAYARREAPVQLAALLKAHGIRYVYFGALGGALDPAILERSPEFVELYADARSRVFWVGD